MGSSKRSISNSQRSKFHEEHEAKSDAGEENTSQHEPQDETYKNCLFSCLVISPAGRPINTFSSIKELLTALHDAVTAHRSLLEHPTSCIEMFQRISLCIEFCFSHQQPSIINSSTNKAHPEYLRYDPRGMSRHLSLRTVSIVVDIGQHFLSSRLIITPFRDS
jgi:Fungal protein kinase